MIKIERIKKEPLIIENDEVIIVETLRVNGKLITFFDKKLTAISRNDLTNAEQKAAEKFVNIGLKIQSTWTR